MLVAMALWVTEITKVLPECTLPVLPASLCPGFTRPSEGKSVGERLERPSVQ